MKALVCSGLMIIMVATFSFIPAAAQTPTITVYFDQDHTVRTMDCPGPSLDTLYVVAENWNAHLSGIEFQIEYPPQMIWLADLDFPPVAIGNTVTGVSMGFGIPQNAFSPLQICRVLVLWNCTDCSLTNSRVRVVPHPIFGFVRATQWPTQDLIYGAGQGSAICPLVNLDIKPGSCPNPFNSQLFDWTGMGNPKKGGVLPVALVGGSTFDVSEVDLSTLRLEGIAPLAPGPKVDDVATPVGDSPDCDCDDSGSDGVMDIKMKFNAQEIAAVILAGVHGETRELTLTGELLDGTPFSASDCITLVGNSTGGNPLTRTYEPVLGPPNPNPFNPTTRIMFELPEAQHIKLTVYDVAGRQVEVLANGTYGEGEHIIEWHARNIPSGVYYYRLVAGNTVKVRRAVVLK